MRVDVVVTDGRQPVTGLQVTDFDLRDNGVPQAIELLEATQVPLNAVLALDTSASTAGSGHADLVSAGQALVDGLVPGDTASLITFSHAVVPRVGPTSDFPRIREALANLPSSGRTALLDGLYVALIGTLEHPGNSLVIAFTDGSDVSSWLTPDDVIGAARRSNAVVYPVTLPNVQERSALKRLADVTGGEGIDIKSTSEMRSAFLRILNQHRARYVLSYVPAGVPPGGMHDIDVRVRRRGVTVKARSNYFGTAPQR